MSLLTIVQTAANRLGIPSPTQVVGNTDDQILQLLKLADEEGQDLKARFAWQRIVAEATFTTTAVEDQGSILTLAGADFDYIVPDTMWDRTQNRPIASLTPQQWQQRKSNGITGPYYMARLRGNKLLINPVPAAGHTVAFEYASVNWCESSGGTGQSAWAADTDVGRVPERLMAMGLIWRWRQYKGLDYAQDFEKYEAAVADAMVRDNLPRAISMNTVGGAPLMTNKNVSEGNWSL